MKRMILGAVAVALVSLAAHASVVEPAYTGPLGNPEMPALRPYKWLWHGTKALVHHPLTQLNAGNAALPLLGTLEGVRGARQGAVDFAESAYHGVIFSVPPKTDQYKKTGKANAYIDNEPLLRGIADLPTLPERVVYRNPAALRERMELIQKHAKEVREQRRQAQANRAAKRALAEEVVVPPPPAEPPDGPPAPPAQH